MILGAYPVIGDRYLSHFREGSETFKALVVMKSATYISESSPLLCSSDVHPSEKARDLRNFRYSLVSNTHQRGSFLLVLRVRLLGSRHLAV